MNGYIYLSTGYVILFRGNVFHNFFKKKNRMLIKKRIVLLKHKIIQHHMGLSLLSNNIVFVMTELFNTDKTV